jgi:Uma2 family endonuclease
MSVMTQPAPAPKRHRFTREEFWQMVELGWFEDQPAEFMDGEIIDMASQGPPHAYLILHITELLKAAFGAGYCVRPQLPLSLRVNGDPNPDLAVVKGDPKDYLAAHPDHALLVVEISESSLGYDRGQKASMYAKAGILDYWIINLPGRQVEVYRSPQPDPAQYYGYGYRDSHMLKAGATVTPLAAPQGKLAVSDLLP